MPWSTQYHFFSIFFPLHDWNEAIQKQFWGPSLTGVSYFLLELGLNKIILWIYNINDLTYPEGKDYLGKRLVFSRKCTTTICDKTAGVPWTSHCTVLKKRIGFNLWRDIYSASCGNNKIIHRLTTCKSVEQLAESRNDCIYILFEMRKKAKRKKADFGGTFPELYLHVEMFTTGGWQWGVDWGGVGDQGDLRQHLYLGRLRRGSQRRCPQPNTRALVVVICHHFTVTVNRGDDAKDRTDRTATVPLSPPILSALFFWFSCSFIVLAFFKLSVFSKPSFSFFFLCVQEKQCQPLSNSI